MSTRRQILERVYDDMRVNGFQGLRADKVIQDMHITKGALYYHFKNKKLLGYAVLEEIIQPEFLAPYLPLLELEGDPIDFLQNMLQKLIEEADAEKLRIGSPVNNLAQEMSPIDEGFRTRVKIIFESIRDIITHALKIGKERGFLRPDIDPHREASFFQATLEGTFGLAKASWDKSLFETNLITLSGHLDSLRSWVSPG